MKKRQEVNLSDVAKLAKVSSSAAGKVLNGGSDQIRVGAEARKRILEAAKKLNYHPNMAASILAGGSSRLIGVFVDSFTNYRTLRLLREIEQSCARLGYRIMTCFSHDNVASIREDYLMLQRYGVNNFICCAHDYPNMKKEVAELFAGAKNVVFMEKPCVEGMPYVRTCRLKALTEMIAEALRNGYRRFGTMHDYHTALTERTLHEEFIQALKLNGLKPDENLIYEYQKTMPDPNLRIRAAMEKMILPYRPDFMFIDDAVYTVTLRSHLEGTGLKIMIHGGNGDPLFRNMKLNTFDPCYEKIAAALLKLLLHPECRSELPVIDAVYRKALSAQTDILE